MKKVVEFQKSSKSQSPFTYLSPLTTSSEANDSSSAISSGVSFTDRAPMFWLKFSTLVVPGMGTHHSLGDEPRPVLVVMGCIPFLVAISLTRSITILLCSRFSGWNLGRDCKQ
ncbi:hypothetical protein SLA2020_415940 [Shorea laevis]